MKRFKAKELIDKHAIKYHHFVCDACGQVKETIIIDCHRDAYYQSLIFCLDCLQYEEN